MTFAAHGQAPLLRVALSLAALLLAVPSSASADRLVIEALRPTSGPPGTEVAVLCRGMPREAALLLGETPLPVLRRGPTRWVVRIPPGARTAPFRVRLPGGRLLQGPRFEVTAPPPLPRPLSAAPPAAAPGEVVRLQVADLPAETRGLVVLLGGRPAELLGAGAGELRVRVPERSPGNAAWRLRAPWGLSQPLEGFRVLAPLRVRAVEPSPPLRGVPLRLQGEGLSASVRAWLGRERLRVLEAAADGSWLRLTAPRRAVREPVVLRLERPERGRPPLRASLAPTPVPARPCVLAVAPLVLVPGATLSLYVAGLGQPGLPAPEAVLLPGREGPIELPVGAVEALTPSAAAEALGLRRLRPGRGCPRARTVQRVAATVPREAPFRGGRPALRVAGVVLEAAVPVARAPRLAIAGFSPRSGPLGTRVELKGAGFSPRPADVRVTLGGRPARVLRGDAHSLLLQVPEGAASGPIEVEVGGLAVRTSQPFVVTHPPRIARFSPRRARPGAVVRIEGSGFGEDPARLEVWLGEAPLEVVSVRPDRIEARLPQGARSGRLRVVVRLEGEAEARRPLRVLPSR